MRVFTAGVILMDDRFREEPRILRIRPSLRLDGVTSIDPGMLREQGVRAVLLDLDNTIVSYHEDRADDAVAGWVRALGAAGIQTLILSNNHAPRVRRIAEGLGVAFISDAKKPLHAGFLRALKVLGVRADEALVVGDQLFTDVVGGNRLGLRTALVRPIGKAEFIGTRLVRPVERLALWGMDRLGAASEALSPQGGRQAL